MFKRLKNKKVSRKKFAEIDEMTKLKNKVLALTKRVRELEKKVGVE
jgi:hypothetical protein